VKEIRKLSKRLSKELPREREIPVRKIPGREIAGREILVRVTRGSFQDCLSLIFRKDEAA